MKQKKVYKAPECEKILLGLSKDVAAGLNWGGSAGVFENFGKEGRVDFDETLESDGTRESKTWDSDLWDSDLWDSDINE